MMPLIRCGSILPFVRWMQANDQDVAAFLRAVDLSHVLSCDANVPIPLTTAIEFMRNASEREGADFPARIVSRASLSELGLIGDIALGARNVREALFGIAKSLPRHVTHEMITASPAPGGIVVREAWGMRMDDLTRHLVQQYVAALIQALCANAGATLPVFSRTALIPHPEIGLSHLNKWFGGSVEASSDKALEIFVPASVADRPLPSTGARTRVPELLLRHPPLMGDGRLSTSVRIVITPMLSQGTPTVDQLARAAGLSVRTFQRRLGEEGTSFSKLLEDTRRELAVAGLSETGSVAGEVALDLGYGQQSSFTRAVRRWTGEPPRTLRKRKG